MTRSEYDIYKLGVQSRTTGANIHYVNGRLGLISIALSILENPNKDLIQEKFDYYTKLIPECINEIREKMKK